MLWRLDVIPGLTEYVWPTVLIVFAVALIVGAFENKADTATEGPVLRIRGTVLFGGVEITNRKR